MTNAPAILIVLRTHKPRGFCGIACLHVPAFQPDLNRLPLGLHGRGEFEFVRAKPLRRELLIAHGYTGQTTETIPNEPQPCPAICVVGVPLKSYVSLSWTYYFTR